ncbi:DEAD/DEAH box helicase [Actinoplanes sp. CA-142083]|uniref:DEAD/DEAH box helicase n=1 Tax=Actinoplanes sp. CA-142083 TaxID=3239903 RepID=UPI003D8AADE1
MPTSGHWSLKADLRPWQQEALMAWVNDGCRGVTAVVTGGGKTFFAFACMVEARRRNPDVVTIIVVPTVALLDQWVVGLVDDLGVLPSEIATYGGGRRASRPRAVNVMVINTARSLVESISDSCKTLLIVDECHRSASPENARALAGRHQATLGLSATPDRDFDDLFKEVVVPALGPVIYKYDYNQARADGVITPFELVNVSVPMKPDEQEKYNQLTRRLIPLLKKREAGADVDDRLHRLLRDRARVSNSAELRLPAAVTLVGKHRRERSIVFHEQIDAANILTQALLNRGHRAAAYHSGLGPAIRQHNLRMFRRGEIDVLVTCRALDEGINVPNASMAVIAASTASTRQRIQRLGRVLRPAPNKSRSSIYTIYASEPEAVRLRAEEVNLEGADDIRWLGN